MADPCDEITTFDAVQAWCGPQTFPGVLFCMWAGSVPAVALPGENWRSSDWITKDEAARRAVAMPWRKP